ncbi:porin [Rhizobium cauense]|uniref:porin n=1 Tax=Rhizobium cauense TaxID=1166683 RepID=UPI001C6ECDE8|nr:porin [Rhizobium cauense]MBW9113340.1 porin [Rhizobium cauense]
MFAKAVFIASLAAFSAISTAHAADAIVAAAPETVEYVRVCDAYGTGYFYIPGTETCLKLEGYLRIEERFGRDESGPSDWSSWTRAQVTFGSKSETEFGTLTGVITFRNEAENGTDFDPSLDEGYIDIAGFRVGMLYSWWDDDPSGETDVVASNETNHVSIRYQYEGEVITAGIALDELEDAYETKPGEGPNTLGIAGQVSFKTGAYSGYLLGSYDTDTDEGAIRAIFYADLGPGQLGLYGVWASGANYYYEESEWTVGAQYEYKVTDKLMLIPGAQYFENVALDADGDGFSGGNAWTAGITVNYMVVENLRTRLSLQYNDEEEGVDQVEGFLRFQLDF